MHAQSKRHDDISQAEKANPNSREDEMDSHFKTDQINVRGKFSPIVLLKQVA
jgi:hypothetical protein